MLSLVYILQKWHPDKKRENNATSRFQDINEAYKGWFSTVHILYLSSHVDDTFLFGKLLWKEGFSYFRLSRI